MNFKKIISVLILANAFSSTYSINDSASRYAKIAHEQWGEGQLALLLLATGLPAIVGTALHLVEDAKFEKILDQKVTIDEEGNPKRNDFDVFFSSYGHYQHRVFNSVKNGAKYICGATSISIASYTAIRLSYHIYCRHRYNKLISICKP